MIISLNSQMNQLIGQAASIIQLHKEEIQREWDQIFFRLKQNETLIDCGPEAPDQLQLISNLFWKHLSSFSSSESDNAFSGLQDDWALQLEEPFSSHKLILIFTMLENAIHKVIGKNSNVDYQVHQSVQHFFSLIVQRFFTKTKLELLDVDYFISQIFSKDENLFLWAAKINNEDNSIFKISSFTPHRKLVIDHEWINMVKTLQGPSLSLLSDAVLRLLMDSLPSDQLDVFPLNMGPDTYLFCINKEDAEQIKPFFTLSLELLKQNEVAQQNIQVKSDWKDSLILFDEWIMLARNFEEAVDKVVSGFVHYLPFKRAALFYYTETENGDEVGLGVMGHKIDTTDIRNIRENLNNIPQIKKTMTRIQPLYVPSAQNILPEKFVEQFELKSIVVVPIYSASNNQVWGGVFLDQGEGKEFEVPEMILSVITKFGQHAGEVLSKYSPHISQSLSAPDKGKLTAREIEILRLMAEGKTIDEAADKLFLSKYTVRDYISFIIKKLDAQNRTQAIAKAIRQGII